MIKEILVININSEIMDVGKGAVNPNRKKIKTASHQ